jgi:hypothetical protein
MLKTAWLTVWMVLVAGRSVYGDSGPLQLAPGSGRPVRISNARAGETYPLVRWRFEVQVEGAILASEGARQSIRREEKGASRIAFDFPDYEVQQLFRAPEVSGFTEYVLVVARKDRRAFTVKRVICGEFAFQNAFGETILHTDGSILKTPVNMFLRSKRGGAILGLCYPYQEIIRSDDGKVVSLGYNVESEVPAGQQFETEPLFIGTYAFSGVGIFKPLEQVAYRFILPHPEERDWAEVWAMQDYVRSKLPYHSVRGENQFFMFLNAWWAGKPIGELRGAMDLMAQLGVPEVMTRETEYGLSSHITRCEQLENLPLDYRFQLPVAAHDLIAYGKSKGVRLGTFVNPTRAFRPEWEMLDNDGKPIMYGQIKTACFASKEAADFTLNIWDQMLKAAGSGFFAFDGRVLTSFNEVDSTYFGPIGPLRCFARNHGHKPGYNAYQDYKNGRYLMDELRRRNPDVFLEVYWGIKRAMPWAMMPFNSCENWYETNGSFDDRMQSWYNQNYRFLPNYQNFAQSGAATGQFFKKSVISSISISTHLMIGRGYNLLDRPENQEFFRKWTQWAKVHHQYLKVKRDLFGQPMAVPLDGSAHILVDRGYIFLFNESGSDQAGLVPLNKWIGLTSGDRFDVTQIYPVERPLWKNVRRGEEVLLPVAASDAVIIGITPASSAGVPLPVVTWHNLGRAEIKLDAGNLTVAGLQGYQGQRREILILVNSGEPRALTINGQAVPFQWQNRGVLAEVEFEPGPPLTEFDISLLWKSQHGSSAGARNVQFDKPGTFLAERHLGSGIYELDMQCGFNRGGLLFKADRIEGKGVVATVMPSWFGPLDGNLAFMDSSFNGSPILFTLGNRLERDRVYRFRLESFAERHSFSILDPVTGQVLAGPFACKIDDVASEGAFGVVFEQGKARVERFAFAPSVLTTRLKDGAMSKVLKVSEAFTSREITRKQGQWAPPGTRMPAVTISKDYAQEQDQIWGGKKRDDR